MSAQLGEIPLENLDENTLEAPDTRIKNAGEGRKVFQRMQTDDRLRAITRTNHQAMLDGKPPFDHSQLVAQGQSDRTNVDWGDAKAVYTLQIGGMIDMNVSVERLVKVPLLRNAVPDDEYRFSLENILSEEITRAVRGWENYDQAFLNLGRCFIAHGIGIAYFEDDIDWRFETTGLGDFLIPNGTRSSENFIAVAGCLRRMEVHELFAKVRDGGLAKDAGWNIEAVKRAIVHATPGGRSGNWSEGMWMEFQRAIRSNDLGYAVQNSGTQKVGVIHLWVQEFNGTVSKYLCAENPLPGFSEHEPWLYEQKNIYEEMRNGFMFFPYGVGEHGTYHSVSGILRDIYPQCQAINRAQGRLLDSAVVAATMVFQPKTETAYERMQFISRGPMTLAPSSEYVEFLDRAIPNVAQGLQPILADFRTAISRRAGQFQGEPGFNQAGVEKTRFQVAAELEQLGKVGATQINLWYSPWSRLMREVVRRLCKLDYADVCPGGKEAAQFRKRLLMRGFPVELLRFIDFDAVIAERAVGAGSGAARTATLTQLTEMSGELDSTGRHNLTVDRIAAALNGNYEAAYRYIERTPNTRIPIDYSIAVGENNDMERGQEAIVVPSQLHVTHIEVHIEFLLGILQKIANGEADDMQMAEPMVMIHSHATEHLEQIQDAQSIAQKVGQFREVLGQTGMVVVNTMRKYIAEQQRAAEESGEQGGEMVPAMMEKMVAAQLKLEAMQTQASLKMQIEEQKHMQKQQHADQKFRQDMAMSDARSAANILASARERLEQEKVSNRERVRKEEHIGRLQKMKEDGQEKVIEMKKKAAAVKPRAAAKGKA